VGAKESMEWLHQQYSRGTKHLYKWMVKPERQSQCAPYFTTAQTATDDAVQNAVRPFSGRNIRNVPALALVTSEDVVLSCEDDEPQPRSAKSSTVVKIEPTQVNTSSISHHAHATSRTQVTAVSQNHDVRASSTGGRRPPQQRSAGQRRAQPPASTPKQHQPFQRRKRLTIRPFNSNKRCIRQRPPHQRKQHHHPPRYQPPPPQLQPPITTP
jgi:hypothetical protein